MIPPTEKVTKKEAIQRIKEITIATSDSYIEDYEDEIRYSHEQEKLSLWIVGLMIAIQLFMISRVEKEDFSTWISIAFASLISISTCLAGIRGLATKLNKTRLIGKYLELITNYRYQKNNILLNLNSNSQLRDELLDDLGSGELVNKIFRFDYSTRKLYVSDERNLSDIERLNIACANKARYAEEKEKIRKEHLDLAFKYDKDINDRRNMLVVSHDAPTKLLVIQVVLTVSYYIYLAYL